jgi:negative regulator of replication initiation
MIGAIQLNHELAGLFSKAGGRHIRSVSTDGIVRRFLGSDRRWYFEHYPNMAGQNEILLKRDPRVEEVSNVVTQAVKAVTAGANVVLMKLLVVRDSARETKQMVQAFRTILDILHLLTRVRVTANNWSDVLMRIARYADSIVRLLRLE